MAKPLIPISYRQASIFALFLVLYEFLTYIANDMIMPGMIKVVASFNGRESDIANSLTYYLLGGASLQLILGPISDRYGRRVVMLSGAVLFFCCTIGIACSNSMSQFMFGRFFQGMGLCFISVVGYAALQEIFAEMDAIRMVALMANVSTIAPLVGPFFGALVVYYTSWRFIFIGISFFTCLAWWGLWKYMPETVGVSRLDKTTLHSVPLSPKTIISNYWALCINPTFMFSCIALGLIGSPCLIWIALSPVLLVKMAHLSIIQYGIWQIPVFGACILGSLFLQRMTHRHIIRSLIFKGTFFVIVGVFLMFAMTAYFGEAYYFILPGILLYFFGIGFVTAPLSRYILFSTPIMKGTASAVMSMMQMSIQALGLLLATFVYQTHHNFILAMDCLITGLVALFFLGLAFYFCSASKAIKR